MPLMGYRDSENDAPGFINQSSIASASITSPRADSMMWRPRETVALRRVCNAASFASRLSHSVLYCSNELSKMPWALTLYSRRHHREPGQCSIVIATRRHGTKLDGFLFRFRSAVAGTQFQQRHTLRLYCLSINRCPQSDNPGMRQVFQRLLCSKLIDNNGARRFHTRY